MIDVAALVRNHLHADPLVGVPVFTDLAPAGSEPPFAVVRISDATRPFGAQVRTWDVVTVLIDIVGADNTVRGLHAHAGKVRNSLHALAGQVVEDVVVQAVENGTDVFGFDPTYVPPLPRWVLTANLTVRSNTPSEGGVVA